MFLAEVWEKLMIKRQTVASACNGRWGKRRSSAIRTLVAETLVLAKTHGYVEKIEDELERELQRDFSDPPDEQLLRWRRKGEKVFKSKHMLLIVVILCIVDCALVLGELALDLYKVKAMLEGSEKLVHATRTFLAGMVDQHPIVYNKSPKTIFSMILGSTVIWRAPGNDTAHVNVTPQNTTSTHSLTFLPCNKDHVNVSSSNIRNGYNERNQTLDVISSSVPQIEEKILIIGEIAHVFHYCSIAILAVILLETILKAICAGKSFFHRKIEVFDAFVVVMSFLMDFSFLVFLQNIDTTDFVFILAILLPWRVIRVVNSLIVSVKDHEHFRLKLVYKRKKKIQGNLRDTEAMLQKYMSQVTTLQRLCIMEGIDEQKIDNHLRSEDSVPPTPVKKKFKFKFEDTLLHNMQGFNKAARCSLPSIDFHGLKLPNNVSRSKLSLPAMAHSIKQHISKKLPSRRASMAATAADMYNAKMSNGDIRRRKYASEDLCTMHEEMEHEENSASSSTASSASNDVFNRSISESICSDRTFTGGQSLSRHNSESTEDERVKLAKIQEEAKRRHSESTIDRNKVRFMNIEDVVMFNKPLKKSIKKVDNPAKKCTGNSIEVQDSDTASDEDDRKNGTMSADNKDLFNYHYSETKSINSNLLSDNSNEDSKSIETDIVSNADIKSHGSSTVVFTLSRDELHFEYETPNGNIKSNK